MKAIIRNVEGHDSQGQINHRQPYSSCKKLPEESERVSNRERGILKGCLCKPLNDLFLVVDIDAVMALSEFGLDRPLKEVIRPIKRLAVV